MQNESLNHRSLATRLKLSNHFKIKFLVCLHGDYQSKYNFVETHVRSRSQSFRSLIFTSAIK